MMELLGNVVGIAIMIFAHIYTWHQLEKKQINFRDYKLYVVIFLGAIVLMTTVSVVDKLLKVACSTIISILLNFYLMRKNIKKTILMAIITQVMIMIGETAIAFILTFLDVDLNAIANAKYGGFSLNIAVSIMVILINFLEVTPRLYQFLLKQVEKISLQYFIVFSFIGILIADIFAMTVYYKIELKYFLLFNSFVTIIYFIIIIQSFTNRNNYLKVNDKYNTTLSSLKEYEDILNIYRVSNHENKNQLLTIRNMIKNSEKNVPDYIDALVENKLKDNEILMGQTSIIPEGGLRGVVYAKSLLMKSKDIQFDLSIDKAIRTVDLHKIGDQTILDICRILGVFLDNAIEAVESLEDKFVDLEMGIEKNMLSISITNNFVGTLDIEKIETMGYSTKGKGHGYGLTLVKEIIENNHLLKNEKRISGNEFTQRLIVNSPKIK